MEDDPGDEGVNVCSSKLYQQVKARGDGGVSGQESKELFDVKLQLGIAQNTIEQLRANAVKTAADFEAAIAKKDAHVEATIAKKDAEIEAVIAKKDAQIEALTAGKTKLVEENAKISIELKLMREDEEEKHTKSRELKRKFAEMNEEHGSLKSKYDYLNTAHVRLSVDLNECRKQLEALRGPAATIAQLRKENQSLEERVKDLNRYINMNDL